MTCVILQPSYIPWRGYFHQIQRADIFVFYDDVQYDKHGWRNRNRVKTQSGTQWLTIPVSAPSGKNLTECPIRDVLISPDQNWQRKHWRTLEMSYSKAPYFSRYAPLLQPYFERPAVSLVDFIINLTEVLARELGIGKTRFLRSSSLAAKGHKSERLLAILHQIGADHYISGPSAKSYLEEDAFTRSGIGLEYMSYDYPPYEQLHPPYDPAVSILDLLFMVGPNAPAYIWD